MARGRKPKNIKKDNVKENNNFFVSPEDARKELEETKNEIKPVQESEDEISVDQSVNEIVVSKEKIVEAPPLAKSVDDKTKYDFISFRNLLAELPEFAWVSQYKSMYLQNLLENPTECYDHLVEQGFAEELKAKGISKNE